MESTGFKLDVLSIVVAEIIFAVLVILLKYILNKMGDR
jgi:preprotein translocase subunit Sec61beta